MRFDINCMANLMSDRRAQTNTTTFRVGDALECGKGFQLHPYLSCHHVIQGMYAVSVKGECEDD